MGEWMYRSTFFRPPQQFKVSGQLHAPAALAPRERAPGIHWIKGWVCPRTGLDDVEKKKILDPNTGLDLRPLVRPALSQSLYRLSYHGSLLFIACL
jgi:hypothetical protein